MTAKDLFYELLDDFLCVVLVLAGINFSLPFDSLLLNLSQVPIEKIPLLLFPICLAITFILLVFSSQVIGRKFDKIFKEKLSNSPDFQIDTAILARLPLKLMGKLRLVRSIAYLRDALFQYNLKKNFNSDQSLFGNFDFRAHMNIFEMTLAVLTAIFAAISILIGILMGLWVTFGHTS